MNTIPHTKAVTTYKSVCLVNSLPVAGTCDLNHFLIHFTVNIFSLIFISWNRDQLLLASCTTDGDGGAASGDPVTSAKASIRL